MTQETYKVPLLISHCYWTESACMHHVNLWSFAGNNSHFFRHQAWIVLFLTSYGSLNAMPPCRHAYTNIAVASYLDPWQSLGRSWQIPPNGCPASQSKNGTTTNGTNSKKPSWSVHAINQKASIQSNRIDRYYLCNRSKEILSKLNSKTTWSSILVLPLFTMVFSDIH